jgi:hypothetical protein
MKTEYSKCSKCGREIFKSSVDRGWHHISARLEVNHRAVPAEQRMEVK